MEKKILVGDAELFKALLTILKYREKKHGFDSVAAALDATFDAACKEHRCPNCGNSLKLFVLVSDV